MVPIISDSFKSRTLIIATLAAAGMALGVAVALGAWLLLALSLLAFILLLITVRRHYKEREQFNKWLIDQSFDITFVLSIEGKILYANESSLRILGHPPETLIGTDSFSHLHEDDRAAVRDAMLRAFALDDSVPSAVPFRVRALDGSWVRLEATSRPVLGADRTPKLIVSARDIRERMELESELLNARRLESVGRLAGGIAHDFNNLLTAILGNASLVRGTLPKDHAVLPEIEEIENSAVRGAELTRRLLAFARRQMIEPRTIMLDEQISTLQRPLEDLAGPEISILVSTESTKWPVKVDPTAFEQALVNLVVNARDAMPGGGTLSIAVSNIRVDEAGHAALAIPSGDWVQVQVTDTGIGIEEQELATIFEPFVKRSQHGNRSGLGLATVFGIVSQAAGYVRVQSAVGRGSTFTMFFPRLGLERQGEHESPSAPDPLAPRARADETILLINGEDRMRQSTARRLRELGYHVLTSSTGAQGISIAATHSGTIHAVVSDILMPTIGGAETVSKIRIHRPDIGVVLISNYDETSLGESAAVPKWAYLLKKPFSQVDLGKAVRCSLDSSIPPERSVLS